MNYKKRKWNKYNVVHRAIGKSAELNTYTVYSKEFVNVHYNVLTKQINEDMNDQLYANIKKVIEEKGPKMDKKTYVKNCVKQGICTECSSKSTICSCQKSISVLNKSKYYKNLPYDIAKNYKNIKNRLYLDKALNTNENDKSIIAIHNEPLITSGRNTNIQTNNGIRYTHNEPLITSGRNTNIQTNNGIRYTHNEQFECIRYNLNMNKDTLPTTSVQQYSADTSPTRNVQQYSADTLPTEQDTLPTTNIVQIHHLLQVYNNILQIHCTYKCTTI